VHDETLDDGRSAHTRSWRDGKIIDSGFALDQVSEHADSDGLVWVDVVDPGSGTLETIAAELGLEPHSVEDAISLHERPKADRYENHLFVNCHAMRLTDGGDIDVCKVSIFVTKHVLVTVRSKKWFGVGPIVARWDSEPELARNGTAGLLYGLLDVVVDGQFDAVQEMDDRLDALEDILFDNRPQPREAQRRTFTLRKSLVRIRRMVLPMREVLTTLMHRDTELIGDGLRTSYQDIYDHTIRASEWADSLRDMVTTIYETNLSLQDQRLNTVMKKVTSWAAIIAIPTAITGFYGQNVPYPGFSQAWGFWLSTVVIVVGTVGLYIGFKHRDWL